MNKHKMKISKFEVWLEKTTDGGFDIVVPVFPEIKGHGATLKEVKALAKEAMELKLEALRANQDTTINTERLIEEEQVNMINNSRGVM